MSPYRVAETICPTCCTFFVVEVEGDEDGRYVTLPTVKCADLNCPVALCPACSQFGCDGCGQVFCADHLKTIEPDYKCICMTLTEQDDAHVCRCCYPPKPEKFCAVCLAEIEASEREVVKIEPGAVVVPAWAGLEVA